MNNYVIFFKENETSSYLIFRKGIKKCPNVVYFMHCNHTYILAWYGYHTQAVYTKTYLALCRVFLFSNINYIINFRSWRKRLSPKDNDDTTKYITPECLQQYIIRFRMWDIRYFSLNIKLIFFHLRCKSWRQKHRRVNSRDPHRPLRATYEANVSK